MDGGGRAASGTAAESNGRFRRPCLTRHLCFLHVAGSGCRNGSRGEQRGRRDYTKGMEKNKTRPVFLNLLQIRLPIGGVVSILHRATGVLLVLALPWLLYGLQQSLSGPAEYAVITARLTTLPARILMLVLLWMFAQHFFSGVRHLLLDLDIGMEKIAARRLAWLTLAASVLILVLAGIAL